MKEIHYKYLVAIIFTCVLFLDRLDLTIVNITLPTVADYFNVPITATDWVTMSFLLALAISIPISSFLGDRFGLKKIYIIAMLLFTAGYLGPVFHVPFWVIFFCYFSMAMGTMLGGWRIIKTMSVRITELKPSGGFCAETSAALSLFGATVLGVPVSTTHTITGAIMGVGATHGLGAVHWSVASRIIWAWVITIPASALIAALTYGLARLVAYLA